MFTYVSIQSDTYMHIFEYTCMYMYVHVYTHIYMYVVKEPDSSFSKSNVHTQDTQTHNRFQTMQKDGSPRHNTGGTGKTHGSLLIHICDMTHPGVALISSSRRL